MEVIFTMDQLINLNNMDNYYEQIVKKRFTTLQMNTIILGLILDIVSIVLCIVFSGIISVLIPVSLILLGVGVWLVIYLIRNTKIEYEYTFVMGEMRIEKIKNQSKRKKIAAFDVKDIDDIGKFLNRETGEKNINLKSFPNVLHVEENETKDDTYYVVIHDKLKGKHALLIFTPNETTLQKLRPYLSVELKKKFLKIQKEEEEYKQKNTSEAAASN